MMDRDRTIERTLPRFQYRSFTDCMLRYNAPVCRLYRWRQAEPAFPAGTQIVGEREPFFLLLQLVRWEIDFARRARSPRGPAH